MANHGKTKDKQDTAPVETEAVDPSLIMSNLVAPNGAQLETVVLAKKDFKTGSRGYHGQGKATINGKRYQVNFMLVEIGSGPKS